MPMNDSTHLDRHWLCPSQLNEFCNEEMKRPTRGGSPKNSLQGQNLICIRQQSIPAVREISTAFHLEMKKKSFLLSSKRLSTGQLFSYEHVSSIFSRNYPSRLVVM
jgi:hypothetical protein